MKLVITGSSGYIGERLAIHALERGHDVVAASRQQPAASGYSWMHYELSSLALLELPSGTDAVIHLAAHTSNASDLDNENEVEAARTLIAATRQAKTKLVFVSSQTARPDAPTAYGRTKWRIEQEVLAAGGWVVRPGQVYGGNERGLFGMLVGTVRKLPVLPAFLPAPKIQTIHVDDLADALLNITEREDISSRVLCLASSEPISFTVFLSSIAECRVRRTRWFVPVPVMLIKLIGSMLGSTLRKQTGLERIYSLFGLPLMDTFADLQNLNIALRSLSSGMHPSGSNKRRSLLREGCAVLTYLLDAKPGSSLLRRYVRAIERLRGGAPLGLPELFIKLPIALSLLGKKGMAGFGKEWEWRLDAATSLAEATPQGAYRFLGIGRKFGPLVNLLWMSSALIGEIFWRVLRVVSYPILQRLLRRKGS